MLTQLCFKRLSLTCHWLAGVPGNFPSVFVCMRGDHCFVVQAARLTIQTRMALSLAGNLHRFNRNCDQTRVSEFLTDNERRGLSSTWGIYSVLCYFDLTRATVAYAKKITTFYGSFPVVASSVKSIDVCHVSFGHMSNRRRPCISENISKQIWWYIWFIDFVSLRRL